MRREHLAGHAMGLFVAFAFGSNYPIAKPVLAVIDPLVFSTLRHGLTGALLILALVLLRQPWRVARADLPKLALLGLVGYTVFQAGWAYGLYLTTPSKAVILIATSPIFAALFGRIMGERLSGLGWLGVALAFVGVFIVVNNSLSSVNLATDTVLGDCIYIAIAAIWALYGALSRGSLLRLGTARTTGWSALIGATLLLPFAGNDLIAQDWSSVTDWHWLAFLYTAVIGGCLGLCAWGGGLARLGLTRITAYLYISPLFGITISGLLLNQWLSGVQVLGAIVVLSGVALTQTRG